MDHKASYTCNGHSYTTKIDKRKIERRRSLATKSDKGT